MATRAASEIVIGPVITERTYLLYTQGRYTFKVSATASKTEIKHALEEQYESAGIKVKDINTVSMRGKKRRSARRLSFRYGRLQPVGRQCERKAIEKHSGSVAARLPTEVMQVRHQREVLPPGEQSVYRRELARDADDGTRLRRRHRGPPLSR